MYKFRDLWPAEKPNVPPDPHGWFTDANAAMMANLLSPGTKCVVELGSWLGKSTRFILDHAPNALVFAVDTWKGGPDHQGPNGVCHEKLPTLYETFLVNCWDYRQRLVPLRMETIRGLEFVLAHSDLPPDLIYIDADHTYEAVCKDIETAVTLFPNAKIMGDDWAWGTDLPVQRAAKDMAAKYGFRIFTTGWPWTYQR